MGVYGGTDLLKIIGFKMGIIYDETEDAADEVEVREVIRERKTYFQYCGRRHFLTSRPGTSKVCVCSK